PGLAHEPDGGVVGGLAQTGAQESVVLKGGKRRGAHALIVAGQAVCFSPPDGGLRPQK
ncbi:MAG: hypothetical protein RLZZ95_1670, partial [Pseudomonadota bacterium]